MYINFIFRVAPLRTHPLNIIVFNLCAHYFRCYTNHWTITSIVTLVASLWCIHSHISSMGFWHFGSLWQILQIRPLLVFFSCPWPLTFLIFLWIWFLVNLFMYSGLCCGFHYHFPCNWKGILGLFSPYISNLCLGCLMSIFNLLVSASCGVFIC